MENDDESYGTINTASSIRKNWQLIGYTKYLEVRKDIGMMSIFLKTNLGTSKIRLATID